MIKKYIKKPEIIEALVFEESHECFREMHEFVGRQIIKIIYGLSVRLKIEEELYTISANVGDYVIKDSNGEIYVFGSDLLIKEYEEI